MSYARRMFQHHTTVPAHLASVPDAPAPATEAAAPATLGDAGDAPITVDAGPSAGSVVYSMVATASMLASGYHGYKRHNGSVGWAIGWGILGAIFPILTPGVALIEGYAQPEKK